MYFVLGLFKTRYQKPGNYACTDCGRMYKWQPSLSNHRKYECGKRASFKCNYCEFVCKLKHNLQKHVLSKHGVGVNTSNIALHISTIINPKTE